MTEPNDCCNLTNLYVVRARFGSTSRGSGACAASTGGSRCIVSERLSNTSEVAYHYITTSVLSFLLVQDVLVQELPTWSLRVLVRSKVRTLLVSVLHWAPSHAYT